LDFINTIDMVLSHKMNFTEPSSKNPEIDYFLSWDNHTKQHENFHLSLYVGSCDTAICFIKILDGTKANKFIRLMGKHRFL